MSLDTRQHDNAWLLISLPDSLLMACKAKFLCDIDTFLEQEMFPWASAAAHRLESSLAKKSAYYMCYPSWVFLWWADTATLVSLPYTIAFWLYVTQSCGSLPRTECAGQINVSWGSKVCAQNPSQGVTDSTHVHIWLICKIALLRSCKQTCNHGRCMFLQSWKCQSQSLYPYDDVFATILTARQGSLAKQWTPNIFCLYCIALCIWWYNQAQRHQNWRKLFE